MLASDGRQGPSFHKRRRVDVFIDSDSVVRNVDCKSIVDTATPLLSHAPHRSSCIDYTSPTDMHCWHCCDGFEGVPVPLPNSKDARTGKYEVYGVFCSFACAKGYLSDGSNFSMGKQLMLLKEMAMHVYHKDVSTIVAAPPRLCLSRFGGELSLSAFRKTESLHTVETPPFLPFMHVSTTSTSASAGGEAGGERRWNVKGIRRPAAPAVVETAGQRGMYFDFLKRQQELEQSAGAGAGAQERGVERERRGRNANRGCAEGGEEGRGEEGANRANGEEDEGGGAGGAGGAGARGAAACQRRGGEGQGASGGGGAEAEGQQGSNGEAALERGGEEWARKGGSEGGRAGGGGGGGGRSTRSAAAAACAAAPSGSGRDGTLMKFMTLR